MKKKKEGKRSNMDGQSTKQWREHDHETIFVNTN